MDVAQRVEHELRRATLAYLQDAGAHSRDEDIHPEELDLPGHDLELALDLMEEWKKREAAARRL